MVSDGALKLDYASVLFVDRWNWTLFSYHRCCVPYTRSLVVHISARLWLSAHKTLFTAFVFHKVVQWRFKVLWDFSHSFVANFPHSAPVKEFWRWYELGVLFLEHGVYSYFSRHIHPRSMSCSCSSFVTISLVAVAPSSVVSKISVWSTCAYSPDGVFSSSPPVFDYCKSLRYATLARTSRRSAGWLSVRQNAMIDSYSYSTSVETQTLFIGFGGRQSTRPFRPWLAASKRRQSPSLPT